MIHGQRNVKKYVVCLNTKHNIILVLCFHWTLCNLSYYRHENLSTRISNQQTPWSRILPQNAIIFKVVKKIFLSLWTSMFRHRCWQVPVTSVCPEPDESSAHILISSRWQFRFPRLLFPSYNPTILLYDFIYSSLHVTWTVCVVFLHLFTLKWSMISTNNEGSYYVIFCNLLFPQNQVQIFSSAPSIWLPSVYFHS